MSEFCYAHHAWRIANREFHKTCRRATYDFARSNFRHLHFDFVTDQHEDAIHIGMTGLAHFGTYVARDVYRYRDYTYTVF